MLEKINIDKINNISKKDFLKNYYHKNIPVVIKDPNFSASNFSQWDASYFEKKWGDKIIPVQKYGPGKIHLPHFKEDRGFENISVCEYFKRDKENLEKKEESDSLLMGKLSVKIFEGMNQEYKLPENLPNNFFDQKVWVYSRGSVTPMHFDVMDTFLVQGKGSKKVYFMKPGTRHMYAFDFFSKSAHFSPIDARQIDLEKFPRLKGSKIYYTEVEEGDVLYIPFGWWHQLEGVGEMNFALAYWYYPNFFKATRHFLQSLRLWRISFIRWITRYPI